MMANDTIERKDRDEHGKFIKGNKVEAPRRGRPSRADSMPMLIAIAEQAYSPEQLVVMLRDTYDKAESLDDWKGMAWVVEFVMKYAVGKPVQRSITASVDPEEIRDIFRGLQAHRESQEDDDDVVDGEASVVE